MFCGDDMVCQGSCNVQQPCGYCSNNDECLGTLLCGFDNLCTTPPPTNRCEIQPCGYCLTNNDCLGDLICKNDGFCGVHCGVKPCSFGEGICVHHDECQDDLLCGIDGICTSNFHSE